MEIISQAFEQNTTIPRIYTCEGENISPPLSIRNAPKGTRSFVLIVVDHDAPRVDFTHWLMWNIAPDSVEIKEGKPPQEAREGLNDFGKFGWGGPCPPSGIHRYEFQLFALDSMINMPDTSSKSDLQVQMNGLILAEASLVGLYGKS